MNKLIFSAALALSATFVIASSGVAQAQDYPNRPVRLIVPFSAGGNTDALARIIGPKVGEILGQTIVVENRPSVSGVIGADVVAKAKPDGYTLLIHDTTFAVAPTLQAQIPWKIEDFAPIAHVAGAPTTLIVNASLPANNVKEVIALAKAKPGELTYSAGSIGGTAHLAGVLFEEVAGVKMNFIPYDGAGRALNDLLGGHLDITYSAINAVKGHLEAGKLKAIASSGAERLPAAPNVPTFKEQGIDVVVSANWGVYAPAGTAPDVIAKLNDAFVRAVKTPEVAKELESRGYVVLGTTPEQHAKTLREEVDRWGALIRRAGIKPQ